jgi:hypothetical protein
MAKAVERLGHGLNDWGSISGISTSILALGPTKLPVQWEQGALPPG